MARFQAQTNAVLDEELEDLRRKLGLRENQRADLLRELAGLAGWVVRQAEAGRRVEARSGKDVEALESPVVERLRAKALSARDPLSHVVLNEGEVLRLAELLEQGFSPTPALRKALHQLSNSSRAAPRIRWRDAKR